MAKILCVEDAPDTLAILEVTLQNHSLLVAHTRAEAEKYLSLSDIDLVLLDIELPDGNGIDLMSRLYAEKSDLPVIFLSGKKDLGSKAAAFSMGAEDFVQKPFEPVELKIRIDAKLRKKERQQAEKKLLKFGNLICHLDEQRVESRLTGETVDLTSLEFKILALMARTPQKIFSRSEILERAWGDPAAVTERAVDVHMSNLRKKLQSSGATIDGVVGTGYRIVATGPSA